MQDIYQEKQLHEVLISDMRKNTDTLSADQYCLSFIEDLRVEKIELLYDRQNTGCLVKAYKGLKIIAKGREISVK